MTGDQLQPKKKEEGGDKFLQNRSNCERKNRRGKTIAKYKTRFRGREKWQTYRCCETIKKLAELRRLQQNTLTKMRLSKMKG